MQNCLVVRKSTDGSTGGIANAKLYKNRTLGLSVWYGVVRRHGRTRRIGTTNTKVCKKCTLAKIVQETYPHWYRLVLLVRIS